MRIDGRWWWFYGEETFDTDETRWLELAGGVVTDREGQKGSYAVEGLGLRIAMPGDRGELVVHQAGPTMNEPIWMSGHFTDEDETIAFARDGDWAVEMTASNRERAGRYSSIDISMYPPDTPALVLLNEATTVTEIEAALSSLPQARVTHA